MPSRSAPSLGSVRGQRCSEMLRRAASLGSCGAWWRGDDAVGACTEGLGSETGDVGGDAETDRHLGQQAADDEEVLREDEPRVVAPPSPEKRPRILLPPPMPRAAKGAFGMRAERRAGRLVLTEVRVDGPRREVFRADRAGGRLRLQFAAEAERSGSPDDGESGSGGAAGAAAEASGGVCNGTVELCQVAAAGQRCLEVGAVMGT
jgi:hypothetical protein